MFVLTHRNVMIAEVYSQKRKLLKSCHRNAKWLSYLWSRMGEQLLFRRNGIYPFRSMVLWRQNFKILSFLSTHVAGKKKTFHLTFLLPKHCFKLTCLKSGIIWLSLCASLAMFAPDTFNALFPYVIGKVWLIRILWYLDLSSAVYYTSCIFSFPYTWKSLGK